MASYLKAAARNPGTTLAAGVATVGLTAVAAPALVATPVLGVLGFTADGVVGGSIAAGVQSVLGNVAVGSVFATAQSAAAGGGGAAVVAGATQIVGGIAAVGAAAGKVLSWVLS
ncbi:hypothetical protein QBC35DRAFT_507915 [Podospora australis]|uniref:Uncharacterized protein n=1 Tax=Podospora australis TaxID=1536484 RepID=A0AAN6WNG5_9PEZI|nr:hypothetical protein QBC35DRAFT_507915 [Podospora australis]